MYSKTLLKLQGAGLAAKMVRLNESSSYPKQGTTAACRSYSCQCRKMLPNNALVMLGPDLMVFSEDERLQKVIEMTKGKKKSFSTNFW